jgi:YD repeat-containing protein
MLTLKDARGIVFLTNAYDANGRVSQQTQADGTTYQLAYTVDGSGKIIQTDVTDPRSIIRRVTFNAAGYTLTDIRAVSQPEQQTYTYEVQANTNLSLSVTDQLGRRTAYTYDTMANVTSVTQMAGAAEAVTTTMAYEPLYNQVTSVTDPLGHATTFGIDAKGNVITVTNALGKSTTLAYNGSGQPISITDPLGNTRQFTYEAGDLSSTTDPLTYSTTGTPIALAGSYVSRMPWDRA